MFIDKIVNNFVTNLLKSEILREHPFAYEKIAAGKSIIGRDAEVAALVNSIRNKGKGAAIYEPPQSGKEMVVREALDVLTAGGYNYILCEINLFNVYTAEGFMELLQGKLSESLTEAGIDDSILRSGADISAPTAKTVLELPQEAATESHRQMIVYIKEFQNILLFERRDFKAELLSKLWSKQTDVHYILTGSMVNAMESIFEERRLFSSMTTIIKFAPIERSVVAKYINDSFLNFGRVIENAEVLEICAITHCKISLVNQFCAICFGQPAGYINRNIVNGARDRIISRSEPYFRHIMSELTPNQISFLKAVLDDVRKFSRADILESYKFNSSANVFRIKDALKKKEVISFDSDEVPSIIDPLFEYWLKYYYFT